MRNPGPLSDLMHLGVTWNWVRTILMNDLTWWETLDLILSKMIHRNLLWSSTIVRKYLSPWMEDTNRGPEISRYKSSKFEEAWDVLIEKGKCFCLAKWQMSQTEFLLSETMLEYKEDIIFNLWWERCPSLKCQMALFGMTVLELQEIGIVQAFEAKLDCTLLVETEEAWNLYNPSCWLAKPIIFRDVESCMMHW